MQKELLKIHCKKYLSNIFLCTIIKIIMIILFHLKNLSKFFFIKMIFIKDLSLKLMF